MSAVATPVAVERLIQAIEDMHADDLVEAYNELFPEEPLSQDEAYEDVIPVVERIVNHINRGLEVEELLDLWNVVFPKHRNVAYDEETEAISFEESVAADD